MHPQEGDYVLPTVRDPRLTNWMSKLDCRLTRRVTKMNKAKKQRLQYIYGNSIIRYDLERDAWMLKIKARAVNPYLSKRYFPSLKAAITWIDQNPTEANPIPVLAVLPNTCYRGLLTNIDTQAYHIKVGAEIMLVTKDTDLYLDNAVNKKLIDEIMEAQAKIHTLALDVKARAIVLIKYKN